MVIAGLHAETVLAAAYATFLIGVAIVLEIVARHTHQRSQQYERAGFTYRRDMDLWDCPAGRQLVRIETDYREKIVRYRAPRAFCNSCSLKKNCTDSDEGRMLENRLDTWVASELRRFHTGLSLTLMVLGMSIVAAELTRHRAPKEVLLLGTLILAIGVAGSKLLAELFASTGKSSRESTEFR